MPIILSNGQTFNPSNVVEATPRPVVTPTQQPVTAPVQQPISTNNKIITVNGSQKKLGAYMQDMLTIE